MWRIRRRRRRKSLSLERATPARVIHLQMPRALKKSQAKSPKIMTLKIRSKRTRKGRNRSEDVEVAIFWGEMLLLFLRKAGRAWYIESLTPHPFYQLLKFN